MGLWRLVDGEGIVLELARAALLTTHSTVFFLSFLGLVCSAIPTTLCCASRLDELLAMEIWDTLFALPFIRGAHIITPRSTFHSLIGALAKAVPGKAHHVLVTLGADRDLAASRDSQFMS